MDDDRFTHTIGAPVNADLLARLAAVAAEDGGVVIVTFLRGRGSVASLFAAQMLAAGAADTHGLEQYRRWLADASSAAPDVADLDGGTSMLTAARG